MVDRLMWRAGFGPVEAGRAALKGMSPARARWTGCIADAAAGRRAGLAPRRSDGTPLRPYESDTDLVLAWCDQMLRTGNPLVERLTFFWHRHFATQRIEVSPPQLMTTQNALFRRYSDLGLQPTANFRTLAYEVGEGPAMLRFLTGEDSTQGAVERELRPRADGAVLPGRDQRGRPAELHRGRRAGGGPRPPPAGGSRTTTRTP